MIKPPQIDSSSRYELRLSKNKGFRSEPILKHSFTIQQANFLLNDNTLRQWSGKSMFERAALFKCKFPYAHITAYKLRKFYKDEKIKKKKIRISKDPAPRHF